MKFAFRLTKTEDLKIFRNNPLFAIFLIPVVIDVIGTVTGQNAVYWQSNYHVVNEAAPVYPFLQIHPLLFIVGCLIIWLPLTYYLTKRLKRPYNLWAAMALFAGHSYNSVNWLRITQKNWGIFIGVDRISITLSLIPMAIYILLIGYIATKGLTRYFSK